ncbi:hypothetical protein KFK14_13930 [Sphingobium phenoxybenzoativorans]|uniref:Uncharacterized protein n=1 Tax=Sphingobium phenoxybenzoativorans TaxID=1592790 RepID=A0A975K3I9_9SPHN|nr:hypothetical protein [Sphingobium phenoxybenzoativorans]QUT04230.1 hypothetical protein KFK14_13930 [Sphingobium phenoxybenzoativorans]
MSRAINLDAPIQSVEAMCAKHSIDISAIEPLPSGGTRVVLRTSDGAADLRRRMSGKVLEGRVVRSGLYMARPPLPAK